MDTESLRLHWLTCHRDAVAAGFPHYAAGIVAAWPCVFGEPWPGSVRGTWRPACPEAEPVAAFLNSAPSASR